METPKNKPVFHKRIFWDVNFEALDYDKKPALLLSGFLNEAMWKTFAIAADTMAMKRWSRFYKCKISD